MRELCLVALCLLACPSERLVGASMCNRECFSGDPKMVGKGICHQGLLQCDEDGGAGMCLGEVLPGEEVCDQVDNDCDGMVDEGLYSCCKSTGPEVCDGKDNDCDGLTDEVEVVDFCYSADKNTAAIAPCRPGVRRCIEGYWVCDGEIAPTAEICDKLDNDCNGLADDGLNSTDPVDILFVIDNSGSMADKIAEIRVAVSDFVAAYGSMPEIRWGVVTAPDNAIPDSIPHLFMNLGTAADFQVAMSYQRATSGKGDEPTLDAIYRVCDKHNPLQISWRNDVRRAVVLFSDEPPQSYATPPITMVPAVVACLETQTNMYFFVDSGDRQWQSVSNGVAGTIKDIQSGTIALDLRKLVSGVLCR